MGNQKQKWTVEEEEALKAGVAKHGPGKWKAILIDPEFASKLDNRSNVDLKDKWRNMGAGFGRTSISISKANESIDHAVIAKNRNASSPPHSPKDVKNVQKYSAMIFEAISSLKDPNGSDLGAIVGFIEQRYEVPPNFRRQMSLRLRRLVLQGKLVKVLQRFKIKDASLGTKATSKQKDVKPNPLEESSSSIYRETVKEAAILAAQLIAEAENNELMEAEAVQELERVSQLAEDTEMRLTLYQEMTQQCFLGGQVFLG